MAEDFKYKIKHLVVVEFQQFLWITFVVLSVFLPNEQCTCLGNQEALSFLFLIPGITTVESLLPITVSFLSIWKDREWWKHGSGPVAWTRLPSPFPKTILKHGANWKRTSFIPVLSFLHKQGKMPLSTSKYQTFDEAGVKPHKRFIRNLLVCLCKRLIVYDKCTK